MTVESRKPKDKSLIYTLQQRVAGLFALSTLVCGLLSLSAVVCLLSSCRQEQVSYDPSLRLTLSTDSLDFGLVFTGYGTSTRRVVLRNTNANALTIDRVTMRDGRFFHVSVDGEADASRWQALTIRGGDSAFIFVRAYIDPLEQNAPLMVDDELLFSYNGNTTALRLYAIGQDVTLLEKWEYLADRHFTADKPYLVQDTLLFRKDLIIDAGATFYMMNNAAIIALGDVLSDGTLDAPVVFRGARTDNLFDSVPYAFASGQWQGIYLLQDAQKAPNTYTFRYTDILSGNVGLFSQAEAAAALPTLEMDGCRIHNMAVYGVVCLNTDATITNSEISCCASYGVYLQGGTHTLVHNTIAAYFGYPYTNLNIHSTGRDDVAAVYINNLSKSSAPMQSYLYNNIITGARSRCLVLAAPLPDAYRGVFRGNYLRADTFRLPQFEQNVYAGDDDTVFVNNHYLYKEYRYYDFHLDSLSPAIGIADEDVAATYPLDRDAYTRTPSPDAGCYQHR